VPLRVGEQTLGVVTLASRDPARPYDPEDLAMTEELARRAGRALDGARQFRDREAQEALKQRRQAAEGLRAIAARARCLLWYAVVADRGDGALYWTLRMADEEAARRFLPLEVPLDQTYAQALSDARLPEDRAQMAWGDEEVRAGRSYRQEFRVRDAHGEIR